MKIKIREDGQVVQQCLVFKLPGLRWIEMLWLIGDDLRGTVRSRTHGEVGCDC
jgi:hypothetical protein